MISKTISIYIQGVRLLITSSSVNDIPYCFRNCFSFWITLRYLKTEMYSPLDPTCHSATTGLTRAKIGIPNTQPSQPVQSVNVFLRTPMNPEVELFAPQHHRWYRKTSHPISRSAKHHLFTSLASSNPHAVPSSSPSARFLETSSDHSHHHKASSMPAHQIPPSYECSQEK
jgi:hypothetical protein